VDRWLIRQNIMASRTNKYEPERVEKIVQALKAGNTRRCASALVGINENTFTQWMKAHLDFREQVTQAEAEAEARNVAMVAKAAAEHDVTITKHKVVKDGKGNVTCEITETITRKEWDAQAAEWWLERRKPQDYGRRLAIAGDTDRPLNIRINWGDERMNKNMAERNGKGNGDDEEAPADDAGTGDPGGDRRPDD